MPEAGAETGAIVEAPATAAPLLAISQVTPQAYVRPPGRDTPGLTRADRPRAETPTPASAPLFSNEGLVRQAELRRRSRVPGPAAGVIGALLASGAALGRGLGSHFPGAKNRATARSLSPGDPGSPDFDRNGDPRAQGGRRRSLVAAILLAGLLGVVLIGFAPAAVFSLLPTGLASSSAPRTSSEVARGEMGTQPDGGSSLDPSAGPVAVVVGDDRLAPGVAAPTTAPGMPATPQLPGPTSASTSGPTSAPTPGATPTTTPTTAPTPTPNPTPTTAPVPTPTAANFVAFEPSGTYSVLHGRNFTFIIDGLGGARCTLSSNPYGSRAPGSQTVPGAAPQVGSIYVTTWGRLWSVGPYTVTATCTLAGRPTATASQLVYIN